MGAVNVGRRTVETSKEDKVLFGDDGIAKGDLVDYYRRIAEPLLHHARGRPISMERFPDGIDSERFYQKKAPDYFPDWIETVSVDLRGAGGRQDQVVLSEAATLVYLANQACITPHVWLSRADDLDRPDRMIFDLDPPGDDFGAVRTAARQVRDVLNELDLPAWLRTTGSRGLHVVVPLDGSSDFDAVRDFAGGVSRLLAERHDGLTTAHRKDKRGERIFVDYLRNAYAQTAVASYAVRALPGAPVAAPLDWDELGDTGSQSYTISNIHRRLGARDDPWKDMRRHARSLKGRREKLDKLLQR